MRTTARTYQIRETLTAYLEREKISIYKLERLCGFSNGYFRNVHFNLPEDKIETVLRVLPNLKRIYLLEGTGEMTNGLPDFGQAAVMSEDLIDKRCRLWQRVLTVLSLEEVSAAKFETEHGMGKDALGKAILKGSPAVCNNFVEYVLSAYPDYSRDWLMTGEGPVKKSDVRHIPVVKTSLHEYYHDKDVVDLYYADTLKRGREWLDMEEGHQFQEAVGVVSRKFAGLDYISASAPGLNCADFAIVACNDAMAPKIVRGDTVFCQKVTDITEKNAVYAVETKGQDDRHTVLLGYAEEQDGTITVISNLTTVTIPKDDVTALAKVVGLLRTL